MRSWMNGLRARSDRVRSGDRRQRGASAVEWVVISFILVMIVTAVGVILYKALDTTATNTANCIQNANPSGAGCGNGGT
jgi:Flp pilus assembly pilin Flp